MDINQRWLTGWKRTSNANRRWVDSYYPRQLEALAFYVEHGKDIGAEAMAQYLEPGDPPGPGWDGLSTKLNWYASLRLWEWERAGMEDQRTDGLALGSALAARHIAHMIDIHLYCRCQQRFGKKRPSPIHLHPSSTVIGLINGWERAPEWAQLQVNIAQRGLADTSLSGPVSAFVINVLAQYFEVPEVHIKVHGSRWVKDVEGDQDMQGLLDTWRNPDPDVVAPHCLAACNLHTHHSLPSSNKQYREIGSVLTRTPVAVLLVFKLRELLGLENPTIEHPLIASMRGRTALAATPLEVDEVLLRVMHRMKLDGYDENQIIETYREQLFTP